MAQWTVALDPTVLAASPGGACTIRVRTSAVDGRGQPLFATFVIRDGETVRSDDPAVIETFNAMMRAGQNKLYNTLAVRPPAPTHDVDTKTREPLPEGSRVSERIDR